MVKLTESTAYLPQHILDNNPSTIAIGYPGDLIIAKGGNTLAKVGLITSQYSKYALSRDIILVRTNNLETYNRYFLWLFLHSEHGQALLWRTASQTGQPHLTLPSVNEINLPKYNLEFEKITEELYKESILLAKKSKENYIKAEQLLLKEFDLLDFKPSKKAVNIKSFSESFSLSGRLDAEYYQPKYDDIEAKLLDQDCFQLKEVFTLKTSASPKKYLQTGIKVIKTKNIRIPAVDYNRIEDYTEGSSLLIQKNDLLFASMGVGSLGRVSCIFNEKENATIDGTIKIFRTKKEYKGQNLEIPALLFLTSKIGQEQIYKYVIGSTGIISISKENVENLLIPKVSNEKAKELTKLVERSVLLKKQSENLLEIAKKAVEIAIEENEERALDFINKETNE